MYLSLLYKIPEKSSHINCIKNLSIDKTVSEICMNTKESNYVVSILSNLLLNKENIIYRQEVCKDFLGNRNLIRELYSLLAKYDEIKEDWDRAKRLNFTIKNYSNNELPYKNNSLLTALQITSTYYLKVTAIPRELVDILYKYRLNSSGLIRIKEYCENIINAECFNKLVQIIKEIFKIKVDCCSFEIIIDFNEKLRICYARLNKIENQPYKKIKTQKSIFSKFKKKESIIDNKIDIPVNVKTVQEMNVLVYDVINEISNLLSDIMKSIYSVFYGISKELCFYNFAVQLYDKCNNGKINVCFPNIKTKGSDIFNCNNLYDMFLVTRNLNYTDSNISVVPNDALLSQNTKGILIKGNNNTGKTVFLRSIGTAQVFAQAGLPITAQSAEISIRNKIFTQFSKSEEEFVDDDISGRFEGEVKEIANIIDQIEPYSLILLNETFQTTAFNEGANAMFDILDIISKKNVKWIFVSHLMKLFSMFEKENNNIIFLHTSNEELNKYKLEKIS